MLIGIIITLLNLIAVGLSYYAIEWGTSGIGINPLVAVGYAWIAGVLSTLLVIANRHATRHNRRHPIPLRYAVREAFAPESRVD